jgi:hypothetical protein
LGSRDHPKSALGSCHSGQTNYNVRGWPADRRTEATSSLRPKCHPRLDRYERYAALRARSNGACRARIFVARLSSFLLANNKSQLALYVYRAFTARVVGRRNFDFGLSAFAELHRCYPSDHRWASGLSTPLETCVDRLKIADHNTG